MLELDENTVRRRAYEIWESDGRPFGREWEHWERAQQELTVPDLAAPAAIVQPMVAELTAATDVPPVAAAEEPPAPPALPSNIEPLRPTTGRRSSTPRLV